MDQEKLRKTAEELLIRSNEEAGDFLLFFSNYQTEKRRSSSV
jgi:hypothetical protein